jgi:hypothetical protein
VHASGSCSSTTCDFHLKVREVLRLPECLQRIITTANPAPSSLQDHMEASAIFARSFNSQDSRNTTFERR